MGPDRDSGMFTSYSIWLWPMGSNNQLDDGWVFGFKKAVQVVVCPQVAAMRSYLAGEAQTGSDAGDGCWDKVVEIAISWSGQLECTEADVIQSLVVDAERLVRVFNKLVYGQSCIVWLHDHIRHLQRQHYHSKLYQSLPIRRQLSLFWIVFFRVGETLEHLH